MFLPALPLTSVHPGSVSPACVAIVGPHEFMWRQSSTVGPVAGRGQFDPGWSRCPEGVRSHHAGGGKSEGAENRLCGHLARPGVWWQWNSCGEHWTASWGRLLRDPLDIQHQQCGLVIIHEMRPQLHAPYFITLSTFCKCLSILSCR